MNVVTTTVEHRQAMIERIRSVPQQLRVSVSGLNDEQLDTPYGAGKWTIRQVVHHLADSHMNAFIRMKLILTEDVPSLKPYNQEVWAERPDGRSLPIESSLLIIDGLHTRWCAMLEGVAENDWQRTAQHPELGTVVLEEYVPMYARHGERHIQQITGLRAEKGW